VVKHDYLPYGEEMGTVTSGNVDKCGTYLRDQTSGLDYADQRYFAGTLGGRFLTADPAGQGTNWYAYVGGDPVNFADPQGLGPIGQSGPVKPDFTVTGTATTSSVPILFDPIWDPFVTPGSMSGGGVKAGLVGSTARARIGIRLETSDTTPCH